MHTPAHAHTHTRTHTYQGTGRRALGILLGPEVNCYTLEVSFYAAGDPSPAPSTSAASTLLPFTPGKYMKLGEDLALTFIDYYDLQ